MAHRRGRAKLKYNKKAEEIKDFTLSSAISTVKELEVKLTNFAKLHHESLRNDAAFRHKFLQMCAPIGVDPLVSSKRQGNWASSFLPSALGGRHGQTMADFYHELAVKVAEVCYAHKSENGGIMDINELIRVLNSRGTKFRLSSDNKTKSTKDNNKNTQKYSKEDILIAITKLSKLGSGFRAVKIGQSTIVFSVPTELDSDHVTIIQCAQESSSTNSVSGLTLTQVCRMTRWNEDRGQRALNLLLTEGMAWLDRYDGEDYYWIPSVWKENRFKPSEE